MAAEATHVRLFVEAVTEDRDGAELYPEGHGEHGGAEGEGQEEEPGGHRGTD